MGTKSSITFLVATELLAELCGSSPSCDCGIRKQTVFEKSGRIVGGWEAGMAEFPWRCYLFVPDVLTCGCTVIHPNWVITAGHCAPAVRNGSFLVDAGDHDISVTTETKPQFRSTDTAFLHPKFNSTSFENDIALIYVQKPFEFNKNVSASCLPWHLRGREMTGAKVTASGWGSKYQNGRPSVTLQKVSLPLISNSDCDWRYPGVVTSDMLCAYDYGYGVCQGDSGSSIDYREPTTGRYHTLGIMSFAKGCGGFGFPGVYTRITKYLDWIEGITGDIFCKDDVNTKQYF